MCGVVPPLPNTPSWSGAQLGGAQGQLYLVVFTVLYSLYGHGLSFFSPS